MATKIIHVSFVMLLAIFISGCSTKNYGRQPELTSYEASELTCREVDIEISKVQGFLKTVDEESSFDGRSILSFLGDFGIGNVMEKNSAVDSANRRMSQLKALKAGKCN